MTFISLFNSLYFLLNYNRVEACLFGAYPLLPNRLVYPEIYPAKCLFSTDAQLVKKLKYICTRPKLFRSLRRDFMVNSLSISCLDAKNSDKGHELISELVHHSLYFEKFKWESIKEKYNSIFLNLL